jgi:murein endopeptidase
MNSFINRIVELASNIGIPTVLIGGLALPAYNVARTTLDIDICIYVTTQE